MPQWVRYDQPIGAPGEILAHRIIGIDPELHRWAPSNNEKYQRENQADYKQNPGDIHRCAGNSREP